MFYERQVRNQQDKAIVKFAKSTKTLFFNPKMVKMLNIDKWASVIVGIDKASGIIILRCCVVEEYGAVKIGPPPKHNDPKYQERNEKCRKVGIGHVTRNLVNPPTAYRAEREGNMVFLESLDDEREAKSD